MRFTLCVVVLFVCLVTLQCTANATDTQNNNGQNTAQVSAAVVTETTTTADPGTSSTPPEKDKTGQGDGRTVLEDQQEVGRGAATGHEPTADQRDTDGPQDNQLQARGQSQPEPKTKGNSDPHNPAKDSEEVPDEDAGHDDKVLTGVGQRVSAPGSSASTRETTTTTKAVTNLVKEDSLTKDTDHIADKDQAPKSGPSTITKITESQPSRGGGAGNDQSSPGPAGPNVDARVDAGGLSSGSRGSDKPLSTSGLSNPHPSSGTGRGSGTGPGNTGSVTPNSGTNGNTGSGTTGSSFKGATGSTPGTVVSPNTGDRGTPKAEPVLTTSTVSKVQSTTTTKMVDDDEPKQNAIETSTAPNTALTNPTQTAKRQQPMESKNDGSSRKALLSAFPTLFTLTVMAVVPMY